MIYNQANKILLVLLVFILRGNIFSQNELPYGLQFNSQEVSAEKKTSLDLTHNQPIELEDSFTISFDISFCHPRFIGTVFRITDKNFSSELYFTKLMHRDTSFLRLNVNYSSNSINYPIPNSIINFKKWFKVKIRYDLKSKIIELEIDGKKNRLASLDINSKINAQIIFGKKIGYELEIPPMRIKNLKIFDKENNLIHHWMFNEIDGNIAHDNIGSLDANVSNPVWLLPKHYHWNLVLKLGPFQNLNKPNINYDSENERVIFVFKDSILFYNIKRNFITKKFGKIPQKQFTTFYSNKHRKLFSQHEGQGKVAYFDENRSMWSKIDTTGEHDRHYYGHNFFEDPVSGNLLMMNGYGWYTVKNHLQEYNFQNSSWKILKLNGDYVVPTVRSSISSVDSEGVFYRFGGVGNISGKQEDRFHTLQDYYKINYKQKTAKKIWEAKFPELSLLPTNNLIIDTKENCFFVGAKNVDSNSEFSKLYKFYLNGKRYEVVGDSISSQSVNNDDLLFPIIFNENQQKFYLPTSVHANKDSFYILLYSLDYRPITAQTLSNLSFKAKPQINKPNKVLFGLIFVSTIILFFFIKRLKQKTISTPSIINQEENKASNEKIYEDTKIFQPNSIYLFRDFKIFDKEGNEITNEFTPKVKQLFLLLFFNSYSTHRNGINIDELSSILWSEYSSDKVKNNRNVTFTKLRKILEKLDGIEIKKEKDNYSIEITNGVYCDYLVYITLLYSNNLTIEKLEQLKIIVSKGELLQGYSFEWLDSIKASFLDDSLNILLKYQKKNCKDSEINSLIADIILHLDSVNEDALSMKVKSLIEMKNYPQAKKVFEYFKKEYFRLFAEEYPKSFEEILN